MRVTSNMSSDNSIYNIQQNQTRLYKLNERLGTQQNVNRPSDDPLAAKDILDIYDKLAEQNQYQTNVTKAVTGMKITDTALAAISDLMYQARGLVSTIPNGSNDSAFRDRVASQLMELKNQIVSMGNTQVGDRYIFAGYDNNVPAFSNVNLTGDTAAGSFVLTNIDTTTLNDGMLISGAGIPANTTITVNQPPDANGSVTLSNAATAAGVASPLILEGFVGTNDNFNIKIGENTTIKTNVSGGELLQGTGSAPYGNTNILAVISKLYTAIKDNDVAGIRDGAAQVDLGLNQVRNARSNLVSRTTRVESASAINKNSINTLETILTNIQNVDTAKIGVELNMQQTAYEASLSTTAKLAKLSLLDYL